jgi:hypothetical protein
MPGHQKEPNRGGYTTSADGGGTYGGCGIYAAEVGGLWDAMLSEGRKFWLFASSDFHDVANDFYPGEFQKTYTWVEDKKKAESIVEGLRSGNSWVVEGDLIDKLEFKARGIEHATMGESMIFDKKMHIMITLRDPESNNNQNQNPTLDHIDLIMGKITGVVDPSDPNYIIPKAPDTKVIARFDNVGGITDLNGLVSIKWKKTLRGLVAIEYTVNPDESCYFRLRGTNHGLNVAGETDGYGNPLLDFTIGANSAEKAWSDLWFYSNPIFAFTSNRGDESNDHGKKKDHEDSYDQEEAKEISVYPNPATEIIRFNNISENSLIEITNSFGVRVMSIKANSNTINVSSLSKGVYIARIIKDQKASAISFVKE